MSKLEWKLLTCPKIADSREAKRMSHASMNSLPTPRTRPSICAMKTRRLALSVRNEGAVLFVEISAPPMNLLGPELIRDLVSLIQQAEADDTVQVLVFKSADPDYFISHVDVTRIKENREAAAKLSGDASIGQMLRHLLEVSSFEHTVRIDVHESVTRI